MSFLGGLKDFFLPSESVSAKRRLDVFGTESKAVAGTVIVGSAAALIAAPYLIAEGGGAGAVLKSAGTKLAASSTSTKVAVAIGAFPVASAIVDDPKLVTKAAGGYVELEKNLAELAKDPTLDKAKKIVKENPKSSVVVGGLLAYGVNKFIPWGSIFGAANTQRQINALDRQTEALERNSRDFIEDIPSASAGLLPQNSDRQLTPALPAEEPLTPQTQVMGRQVTGTTRKRRASKMRPERPLRVYNRVNILNQQIDK